MWCGEYFIGQKSVWPEAVSGAREARPPNTQKALPNVGRHGIASLKVWAHYAI